MKLMDILKNLTMKATAKNGDLILFSDIIGACKLYGQDNHHYIEALLKELEKQELLVISYMTDEGFEDLIVGIKLND